MVFFDMSGTGYDPGRLATELLNKGIKINPPENGIMRFVTNYWVTEDDIRYVVDCVENIVK